MLDDLFQADTQAGAQDLVLRPLPPRLTEPSKFSAWKLTTAAPRGVTAGAAQSGGFFADVLGAFGQAAAASYTGDMLGGMTEQQRQETEQAAQKMRTEGLDFSSEAGDILRGVARDYAPDPNTAHAAERLVFDFSRFAGKAVGYSVAGGPLVGAALTGADEGLTTADDLKQQGVDLATRAKVGGIVGAVSALGVGLPMAGRTALQTTGLVAAGGPLSFMGQQAAVRSILQDADYTKLAGQYDPLDPVGLAISTLVPAGFGLHGLRVNKAAAAAKAAKAAEDFRAGPVPSAETGTAAAVREAYSPAPEHVDGARVLLAVERQRAANVLPGLAGEQAHQVALTRAMDQIARGEPVLIGNVVEAPDLTAARAITSQIEVLQAEREALIPQAANLAEPGAIREARQELRTMEQQRPDTSDAATRELAKTIQAEQGVGYKAALADAKKQISGAVQDFEARTQRLEQAIETNSQAQKATQRMGELDRQVQALQGQLGPEAKLLRFAVEVAQGARQMTEQLAAQQPPAPKGARPDAQPAREPTPPAVKAAPQAAPDQAGAGRAAARPGAADGAAAGRSADQAGLVEAAAAQRIERLGQQFPELRVQLDGMDAPMPLAEFMAKVKAEADEMAADAPLYQVASECALMHGF